MSKTTIHMSLDDIIKKNKEGKSRKTDEQEKSNLPIDGRKNNDGSRKQASEKTRKRAAERRRAEAKRNNTNHRNRPNLGRMNRPNQDGRNRARNKRWNNNNNEIGTVNHGASSSRSKIMERITDPSQKMQKLESRPNDINLNNQGSLMIPSIFNRRVKQDSLQFEQTNLSTNFQRERQQLQEKMQYIHEGRQEDLDLNKHKVQLIKEKMEQLQQLQQERTEKDQQNSNMQQFDQLQQHMQQLQEERQQLQDEKQELDYNRLTLLRETQGFRQDLKFQRRQLEDELQDRLKQQWLNNQQVDLHDRQLIDQQLNDNQFQGQPPLNQYRDQGPVNQYRDQGPVNQYRDQAPVNQYRDQAPVNQYSDQRPVNQSRDQPPMNQFRGQVNGFHVNDNPPRKTGNLLVSNLQFGVTESDLMDLFSRCGSLTRCSLQRNPQKGSFCTADVQFSDPAAAQEAFNRYNGVILDGRPMMIQIPNENEIETSRPEVNNPQRAEKMHKRQPRTRKTRSRNRD